MDAWPALANASQPLGPVPSPHALHARRPLLLVRTRDERLYVYRLQQCAADTGAAMADAELCLLRQPLDWTRCAVACDCCRCTAGFCAGTNPFRSMSLMMSTRLCLPITSADALCLRGSTWLGGVVRRASCALHGGPSPSTGSRLTFSSVRAQAAGTEHRRPRRRQPALHAGTLQGRRRAAQQRRRRRRWRCRALCTVPGRLRHGPPAHVAAGASRHVPRAHHGQPRSFGRLSRACSGAYCGHGGVESQGPRNQGHGAGAQLCRGHRGRKRVRVALLQDAEQRAQPPAGCL